jgi:thiamine pyrophosphate-dependent acetolactate synthase large subunit-like protein
MEAIQVKDPTKVGDSISDAIQMNKPVLVEVPVGPMPVPGFFGQRPQAPKRPE